MFVFWKLFWHNLYCTCDHPDLLKVVRLTTKKLKLSSQLLKSNCNVINTYYRSVVKNPYPRYSRSTYIVFVKGAYLSWFWMVSKKLFNINKIEICCESKKNICKTNSKKSQQTDRWKTSFQDIAMRANSWSRLCQKTDWKGNICTVQIRDYN